MKNRFEISLDAPPDISFSPDLGGGSVMGNALDRGVGYTPYGGKWYSAGLGQSNHPESRSLRHALRYGSRATERRSRQNRDGSST